jgi:hypothetical protein
MEFLIEEVTGEKKHSYKNEKQAKEERSTI